MNKFYYYKNSFDYPIFTISKDFYYCLNSVRVVSYTDIERVLKNMTEYKEMSMYYE